MDLYIYDGPVMEFEKCIVDRWKGETRAISAEKAKSNLTYQFKKKHNRLPSSNIILTGEVEKVL